MNRHTFNAIRALADRHLEDRDELGQAASSVYEYLFSHYPRWTKEFNDQPDWDAADSHLQACERAYSAIGGLGQPTMTTVINPVRDRYNKGERTRELYKEIMAIAL